jgi:3-hydroxyacyl-[acyl-carrier-protein] dehydratase
MKLGLQEILRALPHRPPMLLLDSVQWLEPSVRIVAQKALRHDDPWFAGHFPAYPVLPGVLIIEALAQAGAVLAAYSMGEGTEDQIPLLANVEQARLRKPVHPGQTLELHVRRERAWGRFWHLHGQAIVDGEVVATAALMAALMPRSALPRAAAGAGAIDATALDVSHAAA